MGVGGQRYVPSALPPEEPQYLLYRKVGGFQYRYGQLCKISPPPKFDPWTVQPVANRCKD